MAALRFTAIVSAALVCGPPIAHADGILGRIRGEVNEPSHGGGGGDSGGSSGGDSRSHCDDDDDGTNPFAELGSWVVIGVVTSPVTIPIVILDDDYDRGPDFPDAPHQGGADGYLRMTAPTDVSRTWAGRLSFDTGVNFDDLYSLNGRLQLEHQNRWGLDASWSTLSERIPGGRDHMTLGDANVVFRFAQGEAAQFYTGIGLNWLTDGGDFDAGFNFTYGADWFPTDPLVVSSSIDLGNLGGATLFRSRTTIGVMIDRFEVYSGFDYLNVEGVDIPTGIAGLRLWY
jgi:hypothetical protein